MWDIRIEFADSVADRGQGRQHDEADAKPGRDYDVGKHYYEMQVRKVATPIPGFAADHETASVGLAKTDAWDSIARGTFPRHKRPDLAARRKSAFERRAGKADIQRGRRSEWGSDP